METWDRLPSIKFLIIDRKADKKTLETAFSIANCHNCATICNQELCLTHCILGNFHAFMSADFIQN